MQHGVLRCNMVCCDATWCAAMQHGVLRCNMVCCDARTVPGGQGARLRRSATLHDARYLQHRLFSTRVRMLRSSTTPSPMPTRRRCGLSSLLRHLLALATFASRMGSHLAHLGKDLPHPCHICTRKWAAPCHICTGTGLTPATSAPGLGSLATSAPGLGSPAIGLFGFAQQADTVEAEGGSRSAVVAPAASRCACIRSRRLPCAEHCTATNGLRTADRGIWRARSRRRCGRGEPGPGADVAGVSPVPVQMWQG
jgi:hypothetical protein